MNETNISIALIAAVARNRAIGRNNTLPWHIPEDFRHFKTLTSGKPVIMGRKTFESIGKPLPNRTNIVISSQNNYAPDGTVVVTSLDEAVMFAKNIARQTQVNEIFVIGGSSVYNQAVPMADIVYLTEIDINIEDADAFFPKLTESEWKITDTRESDEHKDNQPPYKFVVFERIK